MALPKFTVITVCRNEASTIGDTVRSLLAQSYQNKEYIIIDGGSTDGTLEEIEKYAHGIKTVRQQKGKGIYNAMNEGISLATGDYVHFLNAGDLFYSSQILDLVARTIRDADEPDIVYGNRIIVNGKRERFVRSYPSITLERLKEGMICHQVIFSKRELFEKNGGFDESFSIVADYDWLIRNVLVGNLQARYLDEVFVKYDGNGISSTTDYRYQKFLVQKRHFGLFSTLENKYFPNVSKKVRKLMEKLI